MTVTLVILILLLIASLLLGVWSSWVAYAYGVWDGTYNPTIPPVTRALEMLHKKGWRP